MRISCVAAACCAATLVGCSSHPLVEDYSRKNTSSIVKKIRCEVRDALRSVEIESPSHRHCKMKSANIADYNACVSSFDDGNCNKKAQKAKEIDCSNRKGDEKTQCEASRKRAEADYKNCVLTTPAEYERQVCKISMRDPISERIEKYRNCQLANYLVGFDFKLDATEKNNAAGGKLDFMNPYIGGKFTLSLGGGAEKTRKSERFFRTIESFESISKRSDCEPDGNEENLIYPIAGNVGMDEVVVTFLELDNSVDLRALDKKAAGSGSGEKAEEGSGGKKSATVQDDATAGQAPSKEFPSIFSDTLTFTTKLNAGIKPTLELNSGAGNFKLRNASIDGTSERLDVHQVAVAMSKRTPDASLIELPAAVVVPTSLSYGGFLNRTRPTIITAPDATPIILELDRLRNKNDDETILESFRVVE